MPWLAKLRLRVFAILVALTIGAIGVIGVFSVPVLPVVGVALVAAYSFVNSMTTKLSVATCSGCGTDLSGSPAGGFGITCASCGTINQPYRSGSKQATQYVLDLQPEDNETESEQSDSRIV